VEKKKKKEEEEEEEEEEKEEEEEAEDENDDSEEDDNDDDDGCLCYVGSFQVLSLFISVCLMLLPMPCDVSGTGVSSTKSHSFIIPKFEPVS